MTFDYRITRTADYLLFELSGIRTRKTNAQTADLISNACKKSGIIRALVDARALERRLGVLDAHAGPTTDFPKDVASKQIKVAVIDRPEFKRKYRFFETVARNAGYFLRIFSESEKAVAWLTNEDTF